MSKSKYVSFDEGDFGSWGVFGNVIQDEPKMHDTLSGFLEIFSLSLDDTQQDIFWEICAEIAQRADVQGRSEDEILSGVWKQLKLKLAAQR
mgnify:CR=1 FL=1